MRDRERENTVAFGRGIHASASEKESRRWSRYFALFIVAFRQKVSARNFATSSNATVTRRSFRDRKLRGDCHNNETAARLVALIENCMIISHAVAERFFGRDGPIFAGRIARLRSMHLLRARDTPSYNLRVNIYIGIFSLTPTFITVYVRYRRAFVTAACVV